MGRQALPAAAVLAVLGVVALAADAAAQNVPSEALLFHRFKIDKKHRTIARITSLGGSTVVQTIFVCPGDMSDSCPFLRFDFRLDELETRLINVKDLDPPCPEGFFAAFSSDERLTGSYEILQGRAGKKREAENATSLLGFTDRVSGERLESVFRAPGGKDKTALILLDVNPLIDGRIEAEETLPSQEVTITGVSADGETTFSVDREFTCFDRVALEDLSRQFKRQTVGDFGYMRIEAQEREDGDPPLVGGAICESGKGSQTKRAMYDSTLGLVLPPNAGGGR